MLFLKEPFERKGVIGGFYIFQLDMIHENN